MPTLIRHFASRCSTFQAGHEGSIPFARSNPNPQLRGSYPGDRTKIKKLCPGRVPVACQLPIREAGEGRSAAFRHHATSHLTDGRVILSA